MTALSVALALLLAACSVSPRRAECLDEFELYTRADSTLAAEQCKRVGR